MQSTINEALSDGESDGAPDKSIGNVDARDERVDRRSRPTIKFQDSRQSISHSPLRKQPRDSQLAPKKPPPKRKNVPSFGNMDYGGISRPFEEHHKVRATPSEILDSERMQAINRAKQADLQGKKKPKIYGAKD